MKSKISLLTRYNSVVSPLLVGDLLGENVEIIEGWTSSLGASALGVQYSLPRVPPARKDQTCVVLSRSSQSPGDDIIGKQGVAVWRI